MLNIFKFASSFFLLLILSFLTFEIQAQVTQEWIQTFNGTGNGEDVANAMAVDNLSNVYVTGYSTVAGNTQKFSTVKYNSSGVQQWAAIYNGPGTFQYGDEGLDILVDDSGNVYVTGSSAAGSTEYTLDYVTIKYNSSGVQQWATRYDSPGNQQDIAFDIALDKEGNVYVTGQSAHPALNANIATIKYNSSGVQQWVAEYDFTGNWDTGVSLEVDALGNVFVAGFHSTDWGTAFLDFVTIKYNSQGIQQWTGTYNGTGNNSDNAVAIGLDSFGNVYVTGYSTGTVYDIVTTKYNTSGVEQWTQTYSSSGVSIDVPNSMVVDPAGNVFITGAISFDFGTIKYNTDGVLQWVKTYNYNGNFDFAKSIAIDGTGNVYVTGVSEKAMNEVSNDYATIKYNPSGEELWVERHNGSANNWDEATSIAVDGLGNVFVTGFVSGSNGYDYGTIKYSQQPVPVELTSFTASAQNNIVILNWATASEINNRGFEIERKVGTKQYGVSNEWEKIGYVEGQGTTAETQTYAYEDRSTTNGLYTYRLKQLDFDGTFEYSAEVEIDVSSPMDFVLNQNYPNPFNPITKISYVLSENSKVVLKIYDMLGKEISELINETKPAGYYETNFDASNLSSGVYIYKIIALSGDKILFTQSKQMILLR